MIDRGALQPLTLRFRDDELEGLFQQEAGLTALGGYRFITGSTVLLWAAATILLPIGTSIASSLAWAVGGSMVLVASMAFAAAVWATTLDRQHALASVLTSANGLVILVLAYVGDVIHGYAVAAIMLLFLFGFVSRTRFVFAVLRTGVIAVGMGIAVAVYDGPESLVIDVFLFTAAGVGSLVGLRLLERNGRRVWHQRLVIEEQNAAIEVERAESERLLHNILPGPIAERLKHSTGTIADRFDETTILYMDLVDSTSMAVDVTPEDLVDWLSGVFTHIDGLASLHGVEKIKTVGDGYVAASGIPLPKADHAVAAARLALDVRSYLLSCAPIAGHPISCRIGLASGPVIAGIIGTHKFQYDLWGDTINTASRMESQSESGHIQVASSTYDLISDRFEFRPRGVIPIKGKGPMKTYYLIGEKKLSAADRPAESTVGSRVDLTVGGQELPENR